MSALVSWLLPILLAALGHAVDAWAQNASHAGGAVGMIAAIWLALRLNPAPAANLPSPVARDLSVDAPAPARREDEFTGRDVE